MEIHTFIYTACTIFIASFVQGMTGFGFIVISVPLLSLLTSIKFAIPLLDLCGFTISGYLFYRLRQDFYFADIKRLLVGGVLGIPIGAFLLRDANPGLAKDILGVIIASFCIISLTDKLKPTDINDNWAYPFGFLSGLVGDAYNANAPAAIIYSYLKNWDKNRFKGTLSVFLFLMASMVIISHLSLGLTTVSIVITFFKILPFLIAGSVLGHFLFGYTPIHIFRKTILILLIFISLSLILSS